MFVRIFINFLPERTVSHLTILHIDLRQIFRYFFYFVCRFETDPVEVFSRSFWI